MSTEAGGGEPCCRRALGGDLPILLFPQSGGFYSAEDADSPPERGMKPKEGAFYVWTVKEVQQLLPEPVGGASEPLTSGQLLMKHYGLSEAGNISSTQVRTSRNTGGGPQAHRLQGFLLT